MTAVLHTGDMLFASAVVPAGSDKPGRWLWAEDDTLATLAVYASACHAGDAGALPHLLTALGDLLPGTKPR